jgi:hypothetical protein
MGRTCMYGDPKDGPGNGTGPPPRVRATGRLATLWGGERVPGPT